MINVILILQINYVFGQVLYVEMQHVMMQIILPVIIQIHNVLHMLQLLILVPFFTKLVDKDVFQEHQFVQITMFQLNVIKHYQIQLQTMIVYG